MTIKERILYQISEATEPGRMTQEEALQFLEELASDIDAMI